MYERDEQTPCSLWPRRIIRRRRNRGNRFVLIRVGPSILSESWEKRAHPKIQSHIIIYGVLVYIVRRRTLPRYGSYSKLRYHRWYYYEMVRTLDKIPFLVLVFLFHSMVAATNVTSLMMLVVLAVGRSSSLTLLPCNTEFKYCHTRPISEYRRQLLEKTLRILVAVGGSYDY